MCKRICITNRSLVLGNYLERLDEVAASDVDILILREKDLSEAEYEQLARAVITICEKHGRTCVLHSFVDVARRLEHPYIHLTMRDFLSLSDSDRAWFRMIGVSTHSVAEAVTAQAGKATYITASHIFETSCKAGLEPRGLSYLREVVQTVEIEVYALGGIHPDNMHLCVEAGADGICMMSEYMRGGDNYE